MKRSEGERLADVGLDDWGATGCPEGPCPPGRLLGSCPQRGAPGPAGCRCSLSLSWGATCYPVAPPQDPQTLTLVLNPSCCAAAAPPGGLGRRDTDTGPGLAVVRVPCSPPLLLLLRLHRGRTCQAAESCIAARRTPPPHDASRGGTTPPWDACSPADTQTPGLVGQDLIGLLDRKRFCSVTSHLLLREQGLMGSVGHAVRKLLHVPVVSEPEDRGSGYLAEKHFEHVHFLSGLLSPLVGVSVGGVHAGLASRCTHVVLTSRGRHAPLWTHDMAWPAGQNIFT